MLINLKLIAPTKLLPRKSKGLDRYYQNPVSVWTIDLILVLHSTFRYWIDVNFIVIRPL